MSSQRELIQWALERLGPEKVARMALAFDDHRTPTGGWWDCPLAYAYGEPGALVTERGSMHDVSWDDEEEWVFGVTIHEVANVFGLDVSEVEAITTAFDDRACEVSRGELLQLIRAASIQPLRVVGA